MITLYAIPCSKDDFDRLSFEIYENIPNLGKPTSTHPTQPTSTEFVENPSYGIIIEKGINRTNASEYASYVSPTYGRLQCRIWVSLTTDAKQSKQIIEYYKTLQGRLCKLVVRDAYTVGGTYRQTPGVSLRLISIIPY